MPADYRVFPWLKHLQGKHDQSSHGKGNAAQVPQAPDAERRAGQVLDSLERRFAGTGFSRTEIKARAEKVLKDAVGAYTLAVRVPMDLLPKILVDGELRNQHTTGTSRGVLNPEWRQENEEQQLGIPRGSKPSDYPIYGYLDTQTLAHEAAGYGDAKIILAKSVRDRTTFTIGDSLGREYRPSLVSKPHLGSVSDGDPANFTNFVETVRHGGKYEPLEYLEAQIHGGVKISDIVRIEFTSLYRHPSVKILSSLEKADIPYKLATEK